MPEVLPNSLCKNPKGDYRMATPWGGASWFILYCASCHKEGGKVMDTFLPAQYAFYLCNDCAERYGEIVGTAVTPDDVFFAEVKEAMEEHYRHYLTEQEILIELGDPNSIISKLERKGLSRR